mmetsp:Transcript_32459/g.49665  ORF Transcript_32459/g.49665 Transcript_32459/m.49665 type:complete len:246 (-) Transcript_32459:710-1447(-)
MIVAGAFTCCMSTICCAGSLCCGCCSKIFGACGVKPVSMPRVAYVLLQMVAVFISFSMMYTLKPAAENLDFIECIEQSGQSATQATPSNTTTNITLNDTEFIFTSEEEAIGTACFGVSAVLRMTFALFAFHAMIFILILPRNGCASVVHDGGWAVKFIAVMALFTGFFWIRITFFEVWAEISRYVSILFLLVESLYILIGAYLLNDYLISSGTSDENWRNWTLLFYTIVLTAASVLILVGCFSWF